MRLILQSNDPGGSGYTYSGLSEEEALEMALWRPLFEGLASGVRSPAKSSAGGVGCLLQRASVLAFRAILLRHGHLFSISQWSAILEQTLIPAIQGGCENDVSPVVLITSESPSVSSIDFLIDSLPLPPPPDDESLMAFKALHPTPNRPVGHAELMLEASFSDLRYGGDGDLRNAYALAKKDSAGVVKGEQPFPDSWVATTASIALGLLTDVSSEVILRRGDEGRKRLWPLIVDQYRSWCIGRSDRSANGKKVHWRPCEALVRIACLEVNRFSMRLADAIPAMDPSEAINWTSSLLVLFSELIKDSVQKEKMIQRSLTQSKDKELHDRKSGDPLSDSLDHGLDHERAADGSIITNFGRGTLLHKRLSVLRDAHGKEINIVTKVIRLDFGATLFEPVVQPAEESIPSEVSGELAYLFVILIGSSYAFVQLLIFVSRLTHPRLVCCVCETVPRAYWEALVPDLKTRCIAAHLLQQSLSDVTPAFLPFASQQNVSTILESLGISRATAEAAVKNEDVSTAFQEALFSEWGDGVAAVDEALDSAARLSHLHGSGMFFLTQEASATNAVIRILSLLYAGAARSPSRDGLAIASDWDGVAFAEPRLLDTMSDVHSKFLDSEKKEGHLIDPLKWRHISESGVKVALYCTCFATVVLEILKIIRSLSPGQFSQNKQQFFTMAYTLIPVRSDEIRQLVSEVLSYQVAPMIGVKLDLPPKPPAVVSRSPSFD